MLSHEEEVKKEFDKVPGETKVAYNANAKKYRNFETFVTSTGQLDQIRQEVEYQELVAMGPEILPLVMHNITFSGCDYRAGGLVFECIRTEIEGSSELLGRTYNNDYFDQMHLAGEYYR